MLSPRSVATQGLGYGVNHVAMQGLWPMAAQEPAPVPSSLIGGISGRLPPRKAPKRGAVDIQQQNDVIIRLAMAMLVEDLLE